MPCGIGRVFLDTNVIQALAWLGEWIWDGCEDVTHSRKFETAGDKTQADYLALRWLFGLRDGFPFETAASEKSLLEFKKTPSQTKRTELVRYGSGLLDWVDQTFPPADPTDAERGLGAGIQSYLTELPDEFDKLLVGEAVAKGCSVFLTLDRRTIRNRSEAVARLERWTGLRVMRPSELWEHFRPWAGLYL